MKCPRCQGLMIYESFRDLSGTENENLFKGWRCLSCGNINDPLIDLHRKKDGMTAGPKGRRRYRRNERHFAN